MATTDSKNSLEKEYKILKNLYFKQGQASCNNVLTASGKVEGRLVIITQLQDQMGRDTSLALLP